jgi:hypothetical protein
VARVGYCGSSTESLSLKGRTQAQGGKDFNAFENLIVNFSSSIFIPPYSRPTFFSKKMYTFIAASLSLLSLASAGPILDWGKALATIPAELYNASAVSSAAPSGKIAYCSKAGAHASAFTATIVPLGPTAGQDVLTTFQYVRCERAALACARGPFPQRSAPLALHSSRPLPPPSLHTTDPGQGGHHWCHSHLLCDLQLPAPHAHSG